MMNEFEAFLQRQCRLLKRSEVSEAMEYSLMGKGKRLRPQLHDPRRHHLHLEDPPRRSLPYPHHLTCLLIRWNQIRQLFSLNICSQ